jgi:hypothetical protein
MNITNNVELIVEQYNAGSRVCDLARRFNCSAAMVCKLLKEFNVIRRKSRTSLVTKEQLYDLYCKQSLSTEEISKVIGLDRPSIGKLLKKFDIKVRSYSQAGLIRSAKISEQMHRQWSDAKYRQKMCGNYASIKEKMACLAANQLGRISNIQKTLYSFLDDLNIAYEPEKLIGFWSYDCFLPDHNIIIECQGDYWHQRPQAIIKDQQKATYLKNFPQYTLKYLWEHEFLCKQRILDLLAYWTGKTLDIVQFELHELKLVSIDRLESELFLGKYHYAGRINKSGIRYAAMLGDDVIAVCVFDSPTRNESSTRLGLPKGKLIELTRFCIHPSYHKKNFASWFLARCVKMLRSDKPLVTTIIAFSDSSYNHTGTIYKASNWRYDGNTKPSYWYVSDAGYVMHKKTLWDHACKMGLGEAEYAAKYGYIKIYGGPKHRFIYKCDRST